MLKARLLLVVCGALSLPAAARGATPADAAAAQALFERGRRAAFRGDLELACQSFAESQRLDPGAGTLMNWATCEARQGKLASAWQHFDEAAGLLQPGDDRKSFVRRQMLALATRVPRLKLHLAASAPAGARIVQNGRELGAASVGLELPVDPGTVELFVTCEGRHPRRTLVSLGEGERVELTLEAGEPYQVEQVARAPVVRPSPELKSEPRLRAEQPEPRSLQRDLGVSLVALGSLGLGLGLASGVVVATRKSTANEHCPAMRCDEAGLRAAESGERWLLVNTLSLSVGAAALVTGGALWLSSPSRLRHARLQPLAGGAQLSFAEQF